MLINSPKGTKDIFPPESDMWRRIESKFAKICSLYGFGEIRVPVFEKAELFQRGVGGTTDIVQKEMYVFEDRAGRKMSLRPEGTAGVVRAFIEHGMSSKPFPVKLFYMLPMYRYENIQEGRQREFRQLGLESFGSEGPESDAEIISLLEQFFDELGIRKRKLKINSLGCRACRAEYVKKIREYFQGHLDELCPDCRKRFENNPLRILDCKIDGEKEIIKNAPVMRDSLDDECKAHFEALMNSLELLGIDYEVDLHMVRGLDYYTRTVFEYVSENVGTQGTICGGGRYNDLVNALGGPAVPALGFALGAERLILEMRAQGLLDSEEKKNGVYIASIGAEAAGEAGRIAYQLRRAGVRAEADLCSRALKAQMKYAGKSGFQFSMVLGDNELESKTAELRNMETGEKEKVDFFDVKSFAKKLNAN